MPVRFQNTISMAEYTPRNRSQNFTEWEKKRLGDLWDTRELRGVRKYYSPAINMSCMHILLNPPSPHTDHLPQIRLPKGQNYNRDPPSNSKDKKQGRSQGGSTGGICPPPFFPRVM